MAGRLYNLGLPRNHFSRVIVDEAGQASEPETLAAFAYNLKSSGSLILAGDPQQLGNALIKVLPSDTGSA